MYVSIGHTMWNWSLPARLSNCPLAIGLLEFIFSAIVIVINQKFFISGTKSFIHLSPNMDSLVALGSGISFLYSTVVLFMATLSFKFNLVHMLYFESAAMILVFISIGKLLEAISKGKTTSAIESLKKLGLRILMLSGDKKEYALKIANEAGIDEVIAEVLPGGKQAVKKAGYTPID